MKKFLTVLLVIAVMFTFSFGSAFATISWTGEATNKYLTEEGDYKAPTSTDKGEEGITEAYRAELTKEAKAELAYVKGDNNPFYAPEKTEAVAAIEAYIEALKTAKTARDAAKLKADLASKVGAWDGAAITQSAASLPQKTKVLNDAAGTNGIAKAEKAAGAGAGSAEIDLTRIATRAADKSLYLPGYVMLTNGTNFEAIPGTASNTASKLTTATGKNNAGTIFVDATNYASADNITKKVIDWFMDNDYRETADFAAGSRAFAAALKADDDAYKKTVQDEFDAIQNEIYNYVDKDAATRRGLAISELEGVDALVKKINDFNDKYAGYNKTFTTKDFTDSVIARLADNYFDQYYTEVSAVPEVKKLTDADKATVIALYKKVVALEDSYTAVWKYKAGSAKTNAYDFAKLEAAYKHFLKADVKAFNELDSFKPYTTVGVGADARAYFDASEKNVSAVKAKRAAYDALVSNYGYADLKDSAFGNYTTAVNDEALILAAEHNQGADADYDVKDTQKLQAYLNNATLKVTTKALGNSKIRVNARFDAETYKDIVAECGNDYTISYKFYQKSAKATSFKGPKEKSRNYITYTKASLKKGTKYKFQCGVVIKDAQGNVVAEKNYRASTTGSRICR